MRVELRDYGGLNAFHGPVRTVHCLNDNSRVAECLRGPGQGAVLVVDGGGSRECALVGDQLGAAAVANGWAGVVVNGCVRDRAVLGELRLGVRALGTNPRRSEKRGAGEVDVSVQIGEVEVRRGDWIYVDPDGVVVLDRAVMLPS